MPTQSSQGLHLASFFHTPSSFPVILRANPLSLSLRSHYQELRATHNIYFCFENPTNPYCLEIDIWKIPHKGCYSLISPSFNVSALKDIIALDSNSPQMSVRCTLSVFFHICKVHVRIAVCRHRLSFTITGFPVNPPKQGELIMTLGEAVS